MTSFIEECRREWRRLRVPDAVANEMAADLAADLAEAEADGVSPEEVLGGAAFDPRSFAAAWAAERGVILSTAPLESRSGSRRPLVLASVATVFVLGLVIAALVNLTARSGVVSAWAAAPSSHSGAVPFTQVLPPQGAVQAGDATALGLILLLVAMSATIVAAWLWATWIRSRRLATPRSA